MATTIVLKNSVTTTNTPSSLAQGEVAINVTDKKVWVGNAATTPVQLIGSGSDGAFSTLSVSGQLTLTNASNYNLYASGAGNNYMAGKLGIGGLPASTSNLLIAGSATGNAAQYGVINQVVAASDVTGTLAGFTTSLSTAAASFTLGDFRHFNAGFNSIGAGSTVTSQYGVYSSAGLTGATNNYGFHGNLAAATGRYNLYMAGTANNYMAGSLGIGITGLTATNLYISKNVTGATVAYGILNVSTVQSDVTVLGIGVRNTLYTQAAAFTLTEYYHFNANQFTIGAGSAITTQNGFIVQSNLTGATNNTAFRSEIAAGTGRYNLYMNGTAYNYLAGNLGVNTTPNSTWMIDSTDSRNADTGIRATNASAGTGATAVFKADNGTASALFGVAGTAYTGYAQLRANGLSVYTGSAAGMGFSADNAAAYITFGTGSSAPERLRIDASGNVLVTGAGGLGYGTGSGGAVTQATNRTTGVTLNKTNGAITLVSAAGSVAYQSFTVTNSTVAATDTIIVNQKSGTDLYRIYVTAVAAGSFQITFATTSGVTTEQPVFNFAVIKAVVA
jgi:hypothetical protein